MQRSEIQNLERKTNKKKNKKTQITLTFLNVKKKNEKEPDSRYSSCPGERDRKRRQRRWVP